MFQKSRSQFYVPFAHKRRSSPFSMVVLALLLGLVILLPQALPALAAGPIVVNDSGDTTGGANCTLRDAIIAANTNTATGGCIAGSGSTVNDTITFAPALTGTTITLSSALPTINTGHLIIDGSVSLPTHIKISGATSFPIFDFNQGSRNFTLLELDIINGNGGTNGAVTVSAGLLIIRNSTFSGNTGSGSGGAIRNNDRLRVFNSTFTGNTVTGGNGGAIASFINLQVVNSTFTGNTATGNGGAIRNAAAGSLTAVHNTIVSNSGSSGGGISTASGGSSQVLSNILANNTGGDCVTGTALTANGYNLIKDTAANACGFINATNGNIIGTDPTATLGALANNGGSTQTIALLTGSPAIDTGVAANCAALYGVNTLDQRGYVRATTCDIGAFEVGGTLALPVTDPTSFSGTATGTQIELTWTDNSVTESGFQIERSTDNVTFNLIATVPANSTYYNDTGLTCNTTYYYQIRATNAVGNSGYLTGNKATAICPPTAPTGLSATAVSATQINLIWVDNSTNESGFKIERSTTATGPWSTVTTTGVSVISYNNTTGLVCGTTYYYQVSATNAGGPSTPISANATTTACPAVPIGTSTLAATVGTIGSQAPKSEAQAVALCNNAPLPSGYTFPFGAFVYSVTGLTNGGTTNMILTLPSALPMGAKIFKCNSANQWVELTNTSDNGDAVVNFSLTDGVSSKDHDGVANGTIVDPVIFGLPASAVGGVAEIISVPTASTGLSYLAGMAGVVMLMGAGWLGLQRKEN